ncbi:MAG: hypothetical protein A2731_04000, partial [Candidatus Buchananbacteria bacterium RIFCSPHIGHO2_01_FULL_39_8]
MSKLSLIVKTRELTGKKTKELKKQGQIPAVLYGHKVKPQILSVNYSEFEKLYSQAGASTLIDLSIDDKKPLKVLIQEVQLDPVSNNLIHIDFYQVRMDEKLKATIELEFIGTPPAVKEFAAILVTNLDSVEVECLPKDLVHEIKVDLSSLKNFNDVIRISDLVVPPGITILNPADEVIALVQEPRKEEEIEAKPTEV